jgi:hypothetical protein
MYVCMYVDERRNNEYGYFYLPYGSLYCCLLYVFLSRTALHSTPFLHFIDPSYLSIYLLRMYPSVSSSSAVRPSDWESLCVQLELTGVLSERPRRERAQLLQRNEWNVERAVQAYWTEEAQRAEDEEEEEQSEENDDRTLMKMESSGSGDGIPVAAFLTPEKVNIEVESDNGLKQLYTVKGSSQLKKLIDHFGQLSGRPLEFFYGRVQVKSDDTPASLGMSRSTERLEARAPAGKKRSFALPATPSLPSAATAAATESLAASLAQSAQSGAHSSSLPANKRLKNEQGMSTTTADIDGAAGIPAGPDASAPSPPPFVPSWSELPLGTVDFCVVQTCDELDDKHRLPGPPSSISPLTSFVRDMERNAWRAGCKADPALLNDSNAETSFLHRCFQNAKLIALLPTLSKLTNAFKSTTRLLKSEPNCGCAQVGAMCTPHGCDQLHTIRLSVSLLPGAHDTYVPQGNFLLPLLHPEFADVVAREIPNRRPPSYVPNAATLIDLSVRTRFKHVHHNFIHSSMEHMDAEYEEKKQSDQPISSAAAAAPAASSAYGFPSANGDASNSELHNLRSRWGLPMESELDDFNGPPTNALFNLSEEEFSHRCGLNVQLRDYQQQTVLWALKQECSQSMSTSYWSQVHIEKQSCWYSCTMQALRFLPLPSITGGMIASEMGTGKTLDLLALIHLNPHIHDASSIQQLAQVKSTLIIVPTSLVGQWFVEIHSRSIRPLKVLCWSGSSRTHDIQRLAEYDVVLTTFGVVASEGKKANNSPMFQCQWHRIVVDESHNIKVNSDYLTAAEVQPCCRGIRLQLLICCVWTVMLFLTVCSV